MAQGSCRPGTADTTAPPSLRKSCTNAPARASADHWLRYFLSQNEAIAEGTVSGVPINLKFLGVGDGLTVSELSRIARDILKCALQDPLNQYPGYISYAASNP